MTKRLAKLSAAFALLSMPLLASCGTTSIPEFSAPVVDAAGIIDDATQQRLDSRLEAFRLTNGPQIAVLTINSTSQQSIEDFSIDVARKWAIGDAQRDDGVLLTIAYDDRALRIETGSGIEAELTDVQTADVIEKMKPALRDGDPSRAVSIGVEGIIAELNGTADSGSAPGDTAGVGPGTDPGVTTSVTPQSSSPVTEEVPKFLVFLLIIALSIISALLKGDRRVGGSSWWGTGGGFSSGGGFGGFSGGFGGGFSGGGSSGSW